MPRSPLEIEVSRRWLAALLWAMLHLGLLLLGTFVSPTSPDGKPLLLSPRRAGLSEYRRLAAGWTQELAAVNGELVALLENVPADLLTSNEQLERITARLQALASEIDSAQPPPSAEPLHALAGETTFAYQQVVQQAAAWLAEPTSQNLGTATAARASAAALLERLASNPWIEATP
jgi:hypothetical protein